MIAITERPIDLNHILLQSKDDSAGATTLFLGSVRDHNEGQNVSGIHYESYKEMSQSVLLEIEKEVLEKWEIKKFIAIHRIGDLKIGDVSVAVSISTEHRKDSFEACKYTIDTIKTRVPIWKKEKTSDGQHWVQTK
jgi:molybdopterin synthase catalytic subunit